MHHYTIYKRTSTGAVQEWHLEQDGNKYRAVSGQLDGKKVEAGWTTCKPKNVGKSNETSGVEQCDLEIEAAYKKKLAQGKYHETIEDIDDAKFFAPMLAKDFTKDFPYDDVFPENAVWTQPKLDGVRCIATADGLSTRQGKPIVGVPHVADALASFFAGHPDAILDGELYCDKLSNDFNKIISLVRKKNPSTENIIDALVVEYHIYDYPSIDGTFSERLDRMQEIQSWLPLGGGPMEFVVTRNVETKLDLDTAYGVYLEAGYEGQIIRINNAKYENKRSKSLLKRKEFKDEEFEILEIVEGIGNRNGMAGRITYKLPNGHLFGSGIRGSHEWCVQLLKDAEKYRGGTGTVRFQDYTPDGFPRFPVTVAVFEGPRDV